MRSRRTLAAISLILGTAVVVAICVVVLRNYSEHEQGPIHVTIHNSYATDISDPRKLSGIVDNIFVGTVIKQERTFSRVGNDVWTLFSVQVEENIKGSVDGIVTVNQEGGFDARNSRTVLVDGDSLLISGETYLFATRFHPDGKWHTLAPVYGDVLITSDTHRAHIRSTFQTAVQNEILYSPQ